MAEKTLIYSINYAFSLVSSLLCGANHYSIVPGSLYKLRLICSDLFWPLKLQKYLTLYAEVHFTLLKLHIKAFYICIYIK